MTLTTAEIIAENTTFHLPIFLYVWFYRVFFFTKIKIKEKQVRKSESVFSFLLHPTNADMVCEKFRLRSK